MPSRIYPRTADEVLNPPVVFNERTIGAVTNFKISNPWSGSTDVKYKKFSRLNDNLNEIYGKNVVFKIGRMTGGSSGSSYFSPTENVIMLNGKFSVVTYLHEYAHVLGKGEKGAVRWSLNLFKQVFPDKFARLGRDRHIVVRSNRVVDVVSHDRVN